MASVSRATASEWSFVAGAAKPCTPGVLLADVDPASHIGLVPRLQEYTYGFFDLPAPNPGNWLLEQQLGVAAAFQEWSATNQSHDIEVTFRQLSVSEQIAGVVPDIQVRKGLTNSTETAFFSGTPPYLPNRRITSGLVAFTPEPGVLFGRDGFYKFGLHEIAHALGLAHPSATIALPQGDDQVPKTKGGTVLNPHVRRKPPASAADRRDDRDGYLPMTPTACDIKAVKNAILR